ncbi:maestro heat-like repeat family member 5 isoform X3 [Paroedura picta]|uniref:maestro heat-like repeat family member 5 isoform X3 n=1 Tax=Paroedura picta TaxID=143630 RepID=UPI004056BED6
MSACNSMLTSLLSEMPNMDGLQEILIHTNGWMESEMPHELERAVRSTSHVLKLAAEHLDFDVSEEFSLLGQLVAVLGMRTMDSVKEIGLQAAEAMYHLHHLTMSKMVKEIEKRPKNKKGNIVKWEREDLFISSHSVFHNDASKVAKMEQSGGRAESQQGSGGKSKIPRTASKEKGFLVQFFHLPHHADLALFRCSRQTNALS